MAEVTMPKLSDTMEEGKILRWLKQAGDRVEVGDLLVEVETDKADMEVEASQAGVLSEVKLGEGESAPVGAVIAVIEDGGGDRQAAKAKSGGNGAGRGKGAAAPSRSAESAAPAGADEQPPAEEGGGRGPSRGEGSRGGQVAPPEAPEADGKKRPEPAPADARAPDAPRAARATRRSGDGVKASPLARSLAEELGVDLTEVRGTGPVGRITRRDVEEASARGAGGRRARGDRARTRGVERADAAGGRDGPGVGEFARRVAKDEAAPSGEEPEREREARPADEQKRSPQDGARRVPLSKMRASIAKRMAESMREAPHFYLTTVVDMDEAVRLREQLKRLDASEVSVTYNHMVVKAVADALVVFPELNARFAEDAIELLEEVNVGIATAVEEGLIVPVLRGADGLGLLEIAEQARGLADKAAGGRFSSADLSGATFSVSNLGMFDVESFAAVINPPQAAILAVGSVKQRAVVRGGALAVGHTMHLTLSCDHRVVDGAQGGRFLAEVKRRLENPAALLLAGLDGGKGRR